jgi:hypothetical protein
MLETIRSVSEANAIIADGNFALPRYFHPTCDSFTLQTSTSTAH